MSYKSVSREAFSSRLFFALPGEDQPRKTVCGFLAITSLFDLYRVKNPAVLTVFYWQTVYLAF